MRFKVLDSWRGIAALLVAAYHFEATSHVYGVSFFRNCFLFVDFFFVLSGFVIAHAYAARIGTGREAAGFTVRRFGRVYPLHFAVLAAFVAVEAFKLVLSQGLGIQAGTPAFDPNGYTPLATLPGHLALTTALGLHDTLTWNGPDWSISAEFWTYIVFAAIVLFAGHWKTPVMAAVGVLAAALLITNSRHGIDVTHELGFVHCLVGFMLGQIVYTMRAHVPALGRTFLSVLEVATLAGVIVFVSIADRSALSFAAPIVFALTTFVFSYEQGPISRLMQGRAFQALGDWSYSIYMVHAFVWFVLGMAVSVVGRKLGVDPWQILFDDGVSKRVLVLDNRFAADAFLLVYIGIVLALASVTKRLIEDPGRRYFGRLADRIEQATGAGIRRPSRTPLKSL